MVLYHGTTEIRALKILTDRIVRTDVERFYTEEYNGNGFSSDGYVYLTNEITFSVYFANSHLGIDSSSKLFLFRFDIPEILLEPDYDEIRYQGAIRSRERFHNDLSYSLHELKSCRVCFDISLDKYNAKYCVIDKTIINQIDKVYENVGYNYDYTTNHYTPFQRQFIDSLEWK